MYFRYLEFQVPFLFTRLFALKMIITCISVRKFNGLGDISILLNSPPPSKKKKKKRIVVLEYFNF